MSHPATTRNAIVAELTSTPGVYLTVDELSQRTGIERPRLHSALMKAVRAGVVRRVSKGLYALGDGQGEPPTKKRAAKKAAAPEVVEEQDPEADDDGAIIGVWSNGLVQIVKGDQEIVLTVAERHTLGEMIAAMEERAM